MKRPILLRLPELSQTCASFLASLDALKSRPVGRDRARVPRHARLLFASAGRVVHLAGHAAVGRVARRAPHWRAHRWLRLGGEPADPDTQPDSLGYVHAPSIPQAIAAAVSAQRPPRHQTGENAAGQSPLNIDMSSRRVRMALDVIYGVAQGQPLAALLGYRFERSLRERDITLARFILPFRRVAPLRPNGDALPSGESVESIAARDVVDGVALLDKWRRDGAGIFAIAQLAAQNPTATEDSDRR